MTKILDSSEKNVKRAAEHLQSGELVAFPTETVYGLGADATSDAAVAKIFEAKGRPAFNPLIVHVYDTSVAEKYVDFNDAAAELASIFWPGALTFILPRRADADISLLCSAGLPTLAVRCPSCLIARHLMKATGRPIAAPSANKSGSLTPTTPKHVLESLGDAVGIILADGKAEVGVESTVLDMTGDVPVLLRHGAVTLEELKMHAPDIQVQVEADQNAPKSPGQLLRHYAPNTPLRLKAVDVKQGEGLLAFGSTKFMGVEDGGAVSTMPDGAVLNLSEKGNLTEAAANLFTMLHQLDDGGFDCIAVMDVPEVELGVAINDRLRRAAED